MQRHQAEHLPAALTHARQVQDVAHADDLLGQLHALQQRTLALLDRAEQSDKLGQALMAIGQARQNVELLAKLLGQINEGNVVNILVSAEWVTIRGAMLEALAPYPVAAQAVAERLQALERGPSA